MPDDFLVLRSVLYVTIAIAVLLTAAFPVLYLFSPWWKSWTGRALMYRAVSYTVLMIGSVWLHFWPPDDVGYRLWIRILLFTFLAGGSASGLYMLWRVNHLSTTKKKEKRIPDKMTRLQLSNNLYDVAKRVVTMGLPALGTLYFAISSIWGLPYADEIVGSLAALTVFLGVVINISTANYNTNDDRFDGMVEVEEDPYGNKTMSLALTKIENPEDIANQKEVVFKVRK